MQYRSNNNTNKVIGALIVAKLVVAGYLGIQFFGNGMTYAKNNVSSATVKSYPTSLPWITTKSDCTHRGKDWRNGKCWDSEHDMLF